MNFPVVIRRISHLAQSIIRAVGVFASWINPVLILLIIGDVIGRYLFGDSAVWVVELEWHFFALIFLLGGAYTLQADRHVRVDVIYQRLSQQGQWLVDLLGHCLLLIPLCLFLIPPAWDYFYQSWTIQEASGDPGGLPALYPIKAVIPIAFVMLLVQSGAIAVDKLMNLLTGEPMKPV